MHKLNRRLMTCCALLTMMAFSPLTRAQDETEIPEEEIFQETEKSLEETPQETVVQEKILNDESDVSEEPEANPDDEVRCAPKSLCYNRDDVDRINTVMEYAIQCKESLAKCLTRPYVETPPPRVESSNVTAWVIGSVVAILAFAGGFGIGFAVK